MSNDTPRVLGGRYEVGELIGRGGMAEVHIGHDARLSRTVAIKILRSDLARDPSFLARFRREAQSAAALNHPAIVSVYDTGEDVVNEPGGTMTHVPYIVMEYVEGHTVRDILRGGAAVPIDEAIDITSGVLGALEYSHRAGIVHRDIKPGNVMITPEGAVKVMDFGIARAMADSQATMTAASAVVGTAQYLSPEQARGETVNTRSDLYSTGCLLFELLTGRPPFQGDSAVAVAYQHVREAAPLPSSISSDIPPELDRITMKSLAKDVTERYQTAAEFRTDLDAAARGGDVKAPVLPPAAVAAGAAAGAAAAANNDATQIVARPTEVVAPVEATRVQAPVVTSPPREELPWEPVATGRDNSVEEQEAEPRRTGLWILLSAIALAAIVGLYFLFTSQRPQEPTLVTVPPVAGQTQATAESTLQAASLSMRPAEEASTTVPAGQAIRTDPAEGEQVQANTEVTVFFSTGPASVTIPNVSGYSATDAVNTLQNMGLVVATERFNEHSKDVESGKVTRTDPPAQTPVDAGSTVTLYISDGQVELPNVVDMNIDDAVATLRDLGLSVTSNPVQTDEKEPNIVLTMSPNGQTIAQGSVVTLTFAVAPPPPTTIIVTETPTPSPHAVAHRTKPEPNGAEPVAVVP